jgi:hypothetical protein
VGVGVGVGVVPLAAGAVDCESLGLGVAVGDGLVEGDVVSEGEMVVDDDAVVSWEAFARTTFLGTTAQGEVAVAVELVAPTGTARAWSTAPNIRKVSAVSAPSAAGLMISGLTRATSLRSASWQDRPRCPGSSQYSRSGLMLVGGLRLTPKVH